MGPNEQGNRRAAATANRRMRVIGLERSGPAPTIVKPMDFGIVMMFKG